MMLMQRMGVSKQDQKDFFQGIKGASGAQWSKLHGMCGVSRRTFRDWVRSRYTVPCKVMNAFSRRFKVPLPKNYKILEPYWYIKKYALRGALARQRIHGLLGDRETRRKGGLIAQQRRRENPEKYRCLGCNVRKHSVALRPSVAFAELVGIILGDGGMTDYQIRVTLDRKVDKLYVPYVARLMQSAFKEKPSITTRENVINITLSGAGFVESLEAVGLRRGNKVKHQVAIPSWILDNIEYGKACTRGLVDTDGSVYFHHHVTYGKRYVHLGLTCTNHSFPLIQGMMKILRNNGFTPSMVRDKKWYIYNLPEIKRYFQVIGSSNPKHIQRFHDYLRSHSLAMRKGAGVV